VKLDPPKDHSCCDSSSEHPQKKTLFFNPLLLVTICLIALILLSYYFSSLIPFRRTLVFYFRKMWWAIALGLLLGGIVDYFVPKKYISKYLARTEKKTIFISVGCGLLMSACSHGILALAIELHKKGASGPAVVSFLLASPWTNLPITLLLVSFFGWRGLLIITSAVVVAILTGLIFQVLGKKGWIECNPNTVAVEPDFSIAHDVMRRFKNFVFTWDSIKKGSQGVFAGAASLARMVLFWILLGAILASLTSAFVPEAFFKNYLSPTTLGLFLTMVFAAILEVCSEGTAPLAFELYRQTSAFGNVFAFLMGGVVTDYTEIGLIWANLGKKTALWMVGVTIPQVVLIAWLFNVFLN
jgi:uncharacterized protein